MTKSEKVLREAVELANRKATADITALVDMSESYRKRFFDLLCELQREVLEAEETDPEVGKALRRILAKLILKSF